MTTWNINEADGHYVGQYSAANPIVAFCEYMALYGTRPNEPEICTEALDDRSYRVIYDSREFILSDTTY